MKKVQPTENRIPCLICDKEVTLVFYPDSDLTSFPSAAFDQAVSCSTYGNYGSQVLDCGPEAYFVICDSCWIKKSRNILFKNKKKPMWSNARDHYEDWLQRLQASSKTGRRPPDEFIQTIASYFK